MPGSSDNIADVERLCQWVPWVDAEEYLLCNDLLVMETSEELCFEVFGHEFVVISQGDSNSEEASVVLHEVIFTLNVELC